MNDITVSTLVEMTVGLASGHDNKTRFDRLLDAIRKAIQCDSVVLLSLQGDTLIPMAMQGLTNDTLGRRFVVNEHPRFAEICATTQPVKFAADSPLPDPFDGLLLDHEGDLPMHSCMGLPLRFGEQLLGVLALDSVQPKMFDAISHRTLDVLSAIASSTLQMALNFSQLERQATQAQRQVDSLNEEAWEQKGGEIIGNSEAMQVLKADISVVAPSNFNILIQGETGVGKELVARTLHHNSSIHRQALVYVNCAAIPESLVESELFGHVKGAFTGADKHRLGKFALADGGTLFLDEIGELPLAAQSKILRALQNNEIQPVGQDTIDTVSVRVLAATNRDLKQEVDEGRFRADLYHRLSVYPITVPALRDRDGDIPLLAGFFLEQARRRLGITQIKLNRDALIYLCDYPWPGNVRELEHVINRAALKARARLTESSVVSLTISDIGPLDNLPVPRSNVRQSQQTQPNQHIDVSLGLRAATEQFQKQAIEQSLNQADFNWAKAARLLKTDRANLVRLAKRLGIVLEKTARLVDGSR
ncbi:nitric oxide reductase transcriptional regulator NorR [Thaumasiovibrio subtropicus]|uniref:nitric oxide reductase transcriptional regulator NorR n=1 Tax=Thaumasiovibrio subtropicus TaxID=1891207 RepID=UPI000B357F6F|nr:nitric oxide reductase transcriptional regulator NorR [Thaumasiovibrio subtropicus]